jgi:FkbH-like protein
MTPWLPTPRDFRGDLRAALNASPHSTDQLERLAALARHRLDFLETIQLDRALSQVTPDTDSNTRIKVAILASSTVDHLAPAIRVAGLRRGLLIDVHVAPFGQYRQELLNTDSDLYRFNPQFVLLSLTAREAMSRTSALASEAEADATIDGTVEELRALWQRASGTLNATVVQQTFLNVADPLFGSYDRMMPGAAGRLIARLNDRVAAAATAGHVSVLDIARASERDGIDEWFDVARWLQGKVEISHRSAPTYGELLVRVIAAHRGLSKKCLVLDLDGTLWGGVVGDDGLDGIVLGEGSGSGEAHLAFQRYVKQLGERGIILAVCSKNDATLAETVFRDHPDMVLRRSDIAAFVANWDDKAVNLKRIADQLNIGLDSLVFVDDNAAERARIRQSLPEVAVPELPDDEARYVRCLADAGYFEAVSVTADDRQRADQYRANTSRRAFQQSLESLDDFLSGLEMSVEYGPFQAVDLPRIAQLVGKTNQFNPTTRRHSLQDIERFAACGRCLTLQFRLSDRFGDNGLVSGMILRADAESPDAFEIDTWVMSCRVFGRGLENEAMTIAVETARRAGARMLRADYLPTPKNGVIKDLYPRLGFTSVTGASQADGATRWAIQVADYVARPTHIARRPIA